MIGVQVSNFGFESALRCTTKNGQYFIGEHIHQFSEIVLVREGEILVTVDGKEEIARAGDIVFITPFRQHSFSTPVYSSLWLAVFSNDFIRDFGSDADLDYVGERSVFTPSKVLFDFLSDKLIDSSERFIIYDRRIYRTMRAAIYAVYEEYTRTVPSSDTVARAQTSVIFKILRYLSTHFKENVTLSSAAKELGYNPEYISHCLSEIKDMNFRYLLNSFRIDYAKNLLLSTKRTVEDIAVESGFSGERSFHRTFYSMIGKTPGEYRRTWFARPSYKTSNSVPSSPLGVRPETSVVAKV
jgi:methylphosphotriester-DNA--protein-cysteine methyltransferase